MAPDTHGLSHIKIVALAIYATGLVAALASPQIRRHSGCRALFLIWLAQSITMSAVDKDIHPFYLVHFMLPVIAILAVWMTTAWEKRLAPHWLVAAMAGALIVVQAAVFISRFRADPYGSVYLNSVAYLRGHVLPQDRIFGSAELAFELGWDGRVIDDFRLGAKTGKQARFVVLDHNRYQEWIPLLKTQDPPAYQQIHEMLDRRYHMVYKNAGYEIYERSST